MSHWARSSMSTTSGGQKCSDLRVYRNVITRHSIQWYVINLRLKTKDDRLHAQVTEDGNKTIPYPHYHQMYYIWAFVLLRSSFKISLPYSAWVSPRHPVAKQISVQSYYRKESWKRSIDLTEPPMGFTRSPWRVSYWSWVLLSWSSRYCSGVELDKRP